VSEKPIGVAVTGLGRAGWGIHVRQLRLRSDMRVVAATDPDGERRKQAEAELGCKSYVDYGEMLRQGDVELVVVATPSRQHSVDCQLAFAAGKHVVTEKPIAMNLAEADAMIAAGERAGKRLFVHYNYRFYPEFYHLKEIVDSGILGRIFHVRNYIASFVRRNDWQTLTRNGGGLLNNHGTHNVDQILQLVPGKVTEVMGDMQHIASAGDAEDHIKALMRFDSGATADIEITMAQNVAVPFPKWIICGTCGTATGDNSKTVVRWFDPKAAGAIEVVDGAARDRKYGNEDKLPWQEKVIAVEPRPENTFYDNVVGVLKRGEAMRVTPQSARETLRVLSMIRESAKWHVK